MQRLATTHYHKPFLPLPTPGLLKCSRESYRPIRFDYIILAQKNTAFDSFRMASRLLKDPGLPAPKPTQSYWQSPLRPHLSNIQSPVLPKTRDIVVIGSGITGCSVAWWLLKELESCKVTVLDAREICSGATGRNGGRINTAAIQDYAKYRSLYDRETAVEIVRFELAHLEAIRSVVTEIGPELLAEAEIRTVDAIATAFSSEKLLELREMLREFEEAFPDLKGLWRIAEREEVIEVRLHSFFRHALMVMADMGHGKCDGGIGRQGRCSMALPHGNRHFHSFTARERPKILCRSKHSGPSDIQRRLIASSLLGRDP